MNTLRINIIPRNPVTLPSRILDNLFVDYHRYSLYGHVITGLLAPVDVTTEVIGDK